MSWAHYILQVNIYLLVFYGFYKLLLDKETYFTLNRIYLVSAGLLSLTIPFLRFDWFAEQPTTQPLTIGVGQLNELMTEVMVENTAPDRFNIGNLAVSIYLLGILFFLGKFIWQLLSIGKLLKRTDKGTAFSFFKHKRIDKDLPQLLTIHKHEEIHIRQLHSLDIILFEVIAIFVWFNPIIYIYKTSIKHIHEYLADDEAAKFQGDKAQYALLLLSSAFGVPQNTLTNSFLNKSLIKKRIFMLHKPRSRKAAILKYGLFVPLFAIALTMSSATIRNNKNIKNIADEIPLNTPIEAIKEVVQESINKPTASQPQKKVMVTGQATGTIESGWEDFYIYAKRAIKYNYFAYRAKLQGNTMIKFKVADGTVENAAIATKLGEHCDAEVMRVIVSYTGYKKIKDGNYTLKVKFLLDGANTPLKNENIAPVKGYTALNDITITGHAMSRETADSNTNDENKIYDFVSIDKQPSFPGGMAQFYTYLKKELKYPEEAIKNNVHGKVFLSFTVEKDGTLNDIKVERKLGSATDEEAVRVLKASPKWIPGTQNGKLVRVKYNLPIVFNSGKGQDAPLPSQNKQGSTRPSGNNTGIRFVDSNGGEMKFGDNPEKSPLYVLDGKLINAADMKALDPNSIESINILKDAKATAIYGAKGANGVILITSKTGKVIEKTEKTKENK
ncbi:MAG: TonB family protein [Candidatus Pedobacter colombiensis]|uniref:TonB family protein n=1 Tax=Candidatus Pedobacter colombiensis TaxID=3121371 RepID=A0AAJ5W6V1_9SPHI|nr:M56 family metallopeptidase [Pedobacter sp.]WEK19117.1 MAG: TonB family protein [Pedobacter sp.]